MGGKKEGKEKKGKEKGGQNVGLEGVTMSTEPNTTVRLTDCMLTCLLVCNEELC